MYSPILPSPLGRIELDLLGPGSGDVAHPSLSSSSFSTKPEAGDGAYPSGSTFSYSTKPGSFSHPFYKAPSISHSSPSLLHPYSPIPPFIRPFPFCSAPPPILSLEPFHVSYHKLSEYSSYPFSPSFSPSPSYFNFSPTYLKRNEPRFIYPEYAPNPSFHTNPDTEQTQEMQARN